MPLDQGSNPLARSEIAFSQWISTDLASEDLRAHAGALQTFEQLLRQKISKESSEYRFRNTVSYWIAISFMEGSLLFAIGAAAAMFHDLAEWQEKALVTCAYFSGGIAFTVGVSEQHHPI